MHMNMSQEPFCVEIYGRDLDWTSGLNTYRKNPSVWPHYTFGENEKQIHL